MHISKEELLKTDVAFLFYYNTNVWLAPRRVYACMAQQHDCTLKQVEGVIEELYIKSRKLNAGTDNIYLERSRTGCYRRINTIYGK